MEKIKVSKVINQNQSVTTDKGEKVDYTGEKIYIGIDVHKKNWYIAIIVYGISGKPFSINASPKELAEKLQKEYPGAEYYTVYEAGFCGTWIHRELTELGIHNIIVNPGDVPTTVKEKISKTDAIDCAKLARALYNGSISSILIPTPEVEAMKALSRTRESFVKMQTMVKNKISGFLNSRGREVKDKAARWSGKYISALKSMQFNEEGEKKVLLRLIKGLEYFREELADILLEIRKEVNKDKEIKKTIELLLNVPGIGMVSAFTLYTELWELKRFSNKDKLASYVGLSPACHNSGDKEKVLGIVNRNKPRLRNILIEASWVAIRFDDSLKKKYYELENRSTPQKAIIRIAKKLLNRIRSIWINETQYLKGYVEYPQNRTITHADSEA